MLWSTNSLVWGSVVWNFTRRCREWPCMCKSGAVPHPTSHTRLIPPRLIQGISGDCPDYHPSVLSWENCTRTWVASWILAVSLPVWRWCEAVVRECTWRVRYFPSQALMCSTVVIPFDTAPLCGPRSLNEIAAICVWVVVTCTSLLRVVGTRDKTKLTPLPSLLTLNSAGDRESVCLCLSVAFIIVMKINQCLGFSLVPFETFRSSGNLQVWWVRPAPPRWRPSVFAPYRVDSVARRIQPCEKPIRFVVFPLHSTIFLYILPIFPPICCFYDYDRTACAWGMSECLTAGHIFEGIDLHRTWSFNGAWWAWHVFGVLLSHLILASYQN